MCKRLQFLLLATATTSLYHKISIVRKYLLENILDVAGRYWNAWAKKNPSDPDAVVTADAGAMCVLVAGAGVAPAIFWL